MVLGGLWPPGLENAPWQAWIGGPIGVLFIAAASWLVARIGAATTALLVIGGQMVTGVALDLITGAPGSGWARAAGVALILAGMALTFGSRGRGGWAATVRLGGMALTVGGHGRAGRAAPLRRGGMALTVGGHGRADRATPLRRGGMALTVGGRGGAGRAAPLRRGGMALTVGGRGGTGRAATLRQGGSWH